MMKRAQQSLEVYDPSFSNVLTVPRDAIVHLPPSSLNISRLVLCRNYTDTNHCAKGHSCKFVHADISGKTVTRNAIHVNYAWRSATHCEYKRLEAGTTLKVYAPNNRAPAELIPSERILNTRGATQALAEGTAISHCAHYHFNRICNRGDKCSFVHAVYVDPSAQNLQKAPAPSMSIHQFPLAEEEEVEVSSEASVAEETVTPAPESHEQLIVADEEEEAELVDAPANNTCVVYQYRHDPYSFYSCHVVLVDSN